MYKTYRKMDRKISSSHFEDIFLKYKILKAQATKKSLSNFNIINIRNSNADRRQREATESKKIFTIL